MSYAVEERGANLSFGEMQTLQIIQSILRKNKIVVMDESTSSFDLETQKYIDELINTEFKKSTVITIANQLNNVMAYDKVLLLD